MIFDKVLPSSKLSQICSSQRKRVYDEPTTLWAWCSQVLEGNASCHKAVSNVQAWREQVKLPVPSSQTKAYCNARKRLPPNVLNQCNRHILDRLSNNVLGRDLWHGLELKAIDGSSVQLMDTAENQSIYPQSSRQARGCGFPVMGICGVANLSHGGWEVLSTSQQTKHDLTAAYAVLGHFGEGDVCLADRAYNSYEFMGILATQGCKSLMRLHQARKRSLDWKKGTKLGKNDRLYIWKKPTKPAPGSKLSIDDWERLPETMHVRISRFKYQKRDGKVEWMYLASNLIDPKEYPYDDICQVYHDRWVIELKFRDVKTMLKMEFIRAKTPDLANKTIQVLQLCYNLIYSLIQSTRSSYLIERGRLSFMGCVNQINSHSSNYKGHHRHLRKRESLFDKLLDLLAEEIVPLRPNRHEPRARKRRPKNYQLLTKPRHEFTEIQHRNTYQKSA